MKKINLALLVIIVAITASLWYLDGYYQPINSDTMAEMSSAQDVRFPEMLTAETLYHSRWFAKILPYTAFTTIGSTYAAITGNKVESLFVSQGFMSALAYVLFIFISAYFVSLCAPVLSRIFILSFLFVSAFTQLSSSGVHHYDPFIFRFYHVAVVGNYIWTFNVMMLAFLPYWRYFIAGKWNDWHNNIYIKTIWLLSIAATAFSSSCTTVASLLVACFILLIVAIFNFFQNKSVDGIFRRFTNVIIKAKHEMYYGLYLLILLCFAALIFESSGSIAEGSNSFISGANYVKQFKDYVYIWKEFLFSKPYLRGYAAVILSLSAIGIYALRTHSNKNKELTTKLILTALFLLSTSIFYSFVIGTEQLPYRYRGTNLGGDTLLYLSWSIMFIILSVTVYFVANTKIKLITPLLIFAAATHLLPGFSDFPYYQQQRKEVNMLNLIISLDKLNTEGPIFLPNSYSNVLNLLNSQGARLTKFAYQNRLTKAERKFVMIDDKVFFETYGQYYPQLKDMVSRY